MSVDSFSWNQAASSYISWWRQTVTDPSHIDVLIAEVKSAIQCGSAPPGDWHDSQLCIWEMQQASDDLSA